MHWTDIPENFDFLMKGLFITIKLAFISLSGSLILGVIIGVLRHTRLFLISWLAIVYIEGVRSIPLILFIGL